MKKSNGNVGNIRRSIYVKLGILGVVLLLVCSALVTSLSHTVDYTNVDYFTDDSETRIHNSNGNYYAATGANLQLAIDDLTDGGLVEIPGDTTITATAEITIGDDTWLRGAGNSSKIVFDAAVNDNLIRNADHTNGNKNIKISDLFIDGNGKGQTAWNEYYSGIYLRKCTDSMIENVYIENCSSRNIHLREGDRNTVVNCWSHRAGDGNESGLIIGSTSKPCGIWFGGETNGSIINNKVWDCFSDGIVYDLSYGGRDGDTGVISNNIVWDNAGGIWTEKSSNVVISNNIVFNNTKFDAYKFYASGIIVGNGCIHVTVEGNDVFNNGGVNPLAPATESAGICVSGATLSDVSVLDNDVYNNVENGIIVSGGSDINNVVISNNRIKDNGNDGIIMQGEYFTVSDNVIDGTSTGTGIFISRYNGNGGGTVSGNTIINIDTVNHYKGAITSASSNVIISNNFIQDVTTGCGMYLSGRGFIVSNNIIDDVDKDGILLGGLKNIVTGNVISNCTDDGIDETSPSDDNIIKNNYLKDNGNDMELDGTISIVKDNIGYDYDSLQDGYIWNSNGKYYTVGSDETNLQAAIDDCNGVGWVDYPADSLIDITTSILLDVELIGHGDSSKIRLADGANCDVITMRDITAENKDIKVRDLFIDGNGNGQTFNIGYDGIHFENSTHGLIENVVIENVSSSGIFSLFCNNDIYRNVVVRNNNPKDTQDGSAAWRPCGILIESGFDMVVEDSYAEDIYSVAFCAESWITAHPRSENIVFRNCFATRSHYGFYVEQVENVLIDGCFAYDNNNDTTAYAHEPRGFYAGSGTLNTYNVTMENCWSKRNGLTVGADPNDGNEGFVSACENTKFINCHSLSNYGRGIVIANGADNSTIFNCDIKFNAATGVYSYGYNPIITQNRIEGNGGDGVYCSLGSPSANQHGIISFNIIRNQMDGGDGIYNKLHHMNIVGNEIYNADDCGIYNSGGNVTISLNQVDTCSYNGIKLADVFHNILTGNNVRNCAEGIGVDDSFFCVVSGNVASDGISETGAANYNSFGNNICYPDTVATSGAQSVETGSIEA